MKSYRLFRKIENNQAILKISKENQEELAELEKKELRCIFDEFKKNYRGRNMLSIQYDEKPDQIEISMDAWSGMHFLIELKKFYQAKLKDTLSEMHEAKQLEILGSQKRKHASEQKENSLPTSKRCKKKRNLQDRTKDKQMLHRAKELDEEIAKDLKTQNEKLPDNFFERYKNPINLFINDLKEINHLALSIGIPQIENKAENLEITESDSSEVEMDNVKKIDPNEMAILTNKIIDQIKKMEEISKKSNPAEVEVFLEKIASINLETKKIEETFKNRKTDLETLIKKEKTRCDHQKPPCSLKAREGSNVFGKIVAMGEGRHSSEDRAKMAKDMLKSHWDNIKKLATACKVFVDDKDNRLVIIEKIRKHLNEKVQGLQNWLILTKNQPRVTSSPSLIFKATLSSSANVEMQEDTNFASQDPTYNRGKSNFG